MVLLDTCAVLWTFNQEAMSARALRLIARATAAQALYVSPVSAWEIGLLAKRGRFRSPVPVEAWVQKVFDHPGVRIAALTQEIAVRSSFLPGEFHDDPADRLLVTTSIAMGIPLITRDRRILSYGAAGHAFVLAC